MLNYLGKTLIIGFLGLLMACTAKQTDANLAPPVSDPRAILALAPLSTSESASEKFLFTLSTALTTSTSFNWTIGTVTTSPSGYFNALSGTASIQAGQTTVQVPIGAINGSFQNGDETFKLTISNFGSTINVPMPTIQFTVFDSSLPHVTQVSSTTANGSYRSGASINVQVNFSTAVVATGSPTLQLATGVQNELATYTSGSGTSTLNFTYVVQPSDTSIDLEYLSTSALSANGGIIQATNGLTTSLTLPAPATAGSLSTNKNIVIDTTVPTTPTNLLDGTWFNSLSQSPPLSWSASTDTGSGLNHYELALGTSLGATDTLNWTNIGLSTLYTATGLALTNATTYYASVRAVDAAGNISAAANGDGWTTDNMAPSQPSSIDDGLTFSSTNLSPTITWSASIDTGSGLSSYQIAIGSTAGGTDIYPWTSVGNTTNAQISGLSLVLGSTYYASVRAVDVAGNFSTASAGDGWVVGWLPQAYLKASINSASSFAGSAVAISGNLMAVASPGYNGSRGNVVVYSRNGATWSQQQVIQAGFNSNTNDQFGFRVALNGTTLVIGDPFENTNLNTITNGSTFPAYSGSQSMSGAVYVYQLAGSTWTQQAYIKASNAAANTYFGALVSISGDTLVVGAPGESSSSKGPSTTASTDTSAPAAGAAYVFQRSGTTWMQQAYLKATNPHSGDYFGSGVSIDVDTVAIGAYQESGTGDTVINSNFPTTHDTGTTASGSAFVYVRSGTTWSTQSYIKSSNSHANDQFGASVAVSGDTLVVGSPGDDSAGAAFVYTRSANIWNPQAILRSSNLDTSDQLGTNVSIDGNLIVVGAPAEDSNQVIVTNGAFASANNSDSGSGAAYVFSWNSTSWQQLAYLKAPNCTSAAAFGTSVSISGTSIAVGAPDENSAQSAVTNGQTASPDHSTTNAGAAYVFYR